jgi:hypothetical protein
LGSHLPATSVATVEAKESKLWRGKSALEEQKIWVRLEIAAVWGWPDH